MLEEIIEGLGLGPFYCKKMRRGPARWYLHWKFGDKRDTFKVVFPLHNSGMPCLILQILNLLKSRFQAPTLFFRILKPRFPKRQLWFLWSNREALNHTLESCWQVWYEPSNREEVLLDGQTFSKELSFQLIKPSRGGRKLELVFQKPCSLNAQPISVTSKKSSSLRKYFLKKPRSVILWPYWQNFGICSKAKFYSYTLTVEWRRRRKRVSIAGSYSEQSKNLIIKPKWANFELGMKWACIWAVVDFLKSQAEKSVLGLVNRHHMNHEWNATLFFQIWYESLLHWFSEKPKLGNEVWPSDHSPLGTTSCF